MRKETAVPSRTRKRVLIYSCVVASALVFGIRSLENFHLSSETSLNALVSQLYNFGAPISNEDYFSAPEAGHLVRDDGRLEINPDAPHPIYQMIRQAEDEWASKLSRASTTLDEAVQEYRRRYRRNPPKGFDKWWDFVVAHQIQLPDEYDQIYKDIEPFWGVDPIQLQRLETSHEDDEHLHVVEKKEGEKKVVISRIDGMDTDTLNVDNIPKPALDIITLVESIQEYLPPFRALFSSLDNPLLTANSKLREELLASAANDTYLDLGSQPVDQRRGWSWACPPDSLANSPLNHTSPPTKPSFIHNHQRSMDPCHTPQLFNIHGQFLPYAAVGGPAYPTPFPRFAYCSTPLHFDIRFPHLDSWLSGPLSEESDPEWEKRMDERLTWRGTNTGIWHSSTTPWRQAQRARLVDFANSMSGNADIIFPAGGEEEPIGAGRNVSRAKVNPAFFDIAFAGSPLGCDPDTCGELSKIYEWRRFQRWYEAGRFKYVVDVDGNGWSSRFKRLLTSNSLVFKATIYPEWFSDKIQPWLHYVPVQVDYSDLYNAYSFFRGGLYGEGANEDLAKKLALAGREWSISFWRKEDMTAYLYRLLLEYGRVMSSDRDSMTYSL